MALIKCHGKGRNLKSFPIIVNNKKIMSDDINAFLKIGKTNEAIAFLEEKTNCDPKEAAEIVQELIDLSKGINYGKKKNTTYERKVSHNVIDCTNRNGDGTERTKADSNQVKCPKCGSTQIQMVPRKWSLMTGFFTNKVDRVCVNCKHRF